MTQNKSNSYFDSVDLVLFIWNKRMPLIIISLIAAVLSIIAGFLIEEKFESQVVIFPAKSGSISQDLLAQNEFKKNILEFGEDEEVEQLLQILNSDHIKGRIIQKYDLMNHYDISKNEKYRKTSLDKQYRKNISYSPTRYLSIRINVLDKDPKVAAAIANDIAALVDTVRNNMQKQRAIKALRLVEQEYKNLETQIRQMEDSLAAIRRLGVVDYEAQALALSEAYSQAILDGNTKAVKLIQNKLNILAEYGGSYVSLRDFLVVEQEHLSLIKAKYAEAKLDVSQNLPATFVVNPAYAAEKKAYPKKSLIVLISTLSAFLVTLLLMAFNNSIKSKFSAIDKSK